MLDQYGYWMIHTGYLYISCDSLHEALLALEVVQMVNLFTTPSGGMHKNVYSKFKCDFNYSN